MELSPILQAVQMAAPAAEVVLPAQHEQGAVPSGENEPAAQGVQLPCEEPNPGAHPASQ